MSPEEDAMLRRPYWTLSRLLNAKGLSRKKFRHLLRKTRGREKEDIASTLLTGAVNLVWEDGKETSASALVYESGGCSSYLKIHLRGVYKGTWKWMHIPESTPTIKELVALAETKRKEGKPVRLTRREKRMFGHRTLTGQDLTVSEFFRTLAGTAVPA